MSWLDSIYKEPTAAERAAYQRESEAIRARQSRMLENPGALLRGLSGIPGSLASYYRGHTVPQMATGLKNLGGMIVEEARTNPGEFITGMLNPLVAGLQALDAFAEARDAARQLRAAGQHDAADQVEQMSAGMAVMPLAQPVLGASLAVAGKGAKRLASKAVRRLSTPAPKAVVPTPRFAALPAPTKQLALPAPKREETSFAAQRSVFPDEGEWSLPRDFNADVPIVTTGPAIIHRPKPVEGWHGTPSVFSAERKVLTPEGTESFLVGKPDVLPDVPPNYKLLKDYPLGRFRSEKLNTGEGAQAYGIGTYLGENPETGRNYRSELTQNAPEASVGGVPLVQLYERLQRRADTADFSKAESLYDQLSALEDLGLHGDIRGVLDRAAEGAYQPSTVDWFNTEIAPKYNAPGALYQVGMHLDPRAMLDWDAPLARQSGAVRDAAANLDLSHLGEGHRARVMLERFLTNREQDSYPLTGGLFMSALPHTPEGNFSMEASQHLLKHGVPGVRYWDEGSRETGRGTRNFVVFDPERDLTIKERFSHGGLAVKKEAE